MSVEDTVLFVSIGIIIGIIGCIIVMKTGLLKTELLYKKDENDTPAVKYECGPHVCANGLVYKDGKCKINFEGEHDLIINACADSQQATGKTIPFDLEQHASRGSLPKWIRHGYESATCTPELYKQWQIDTGKIT